MSLKVESLYKNFGETKALDGMSFTVQKGDLFGFVGSNGAGKTTTMRVILGLLKADCGKVTCEDQNIDFELRKRFGYMPEERGLYPRMEVQEQLEYLAKLQGVKQKEAREIVLYWTERLGVAARRHDKVQALSLGNQQRVQLCASLVHNPDYLVLDEPFSGLDPIAVATMSEVLQERVAQGATVIFSSHQLDLVERLCNRVAICSLGKVAAEGSIDELRQTENLIYDLRTDQQDIAPVSLALRELGVNVAQHVGKANELRLVLPSQISEQQVLRTALDIAPVRNFAQYRPHLTELFSNVVSIPVDFEASDAEASARKKGKKKAHGKFKVFGRK